MFLLWRQSPPLASDLWVFLLPLLPLGPDLIWVSYPPILLHGASTDCFLVIIIVIRLVWTWIESALIKAE